MPAAGTPLLERHCTRWTAGIPYITHLAGHPAMLVRLESCAMMSLMQRRAVPPLAPLVDRYGLWLVARGSLISSALSLGPALCSRRTRPPAQHSIVRRWRGDIPDKPARRVRAVESGMASIARRTSRPCVCLRTVHGVYQHSGEIPSQVCKVPSGQPKPVAAEAREALARAAEAIERLFVYNPLGRLRSYRRSIATTGDGSVCNK